MKGMSVTTARGTMTEDSLQWFIKSREGLWWRADGHGYTNQLYEAGLYSTKDVQKYSSRSYADRHDTFHHISELRTEIAAMYDVSCSLFEDLLRHPNKPNV